MKSTLGAAKTRFHALNRTTSVIKKIRIPADYFRRRRAARGMALLQGHCILLGGLIIITINVSTRPQHPVVVALYVNAALLAVIVGILLSRNSGPSILPAAMAQNAAPIGGASGCFIMPGQFADKSW